MDVKVGDRVLFGKYAGQTVKVDGQELLVMREEDIMGVVEGLSLPHPLFKQAGALPGPNHISEF
jgi:hypothetical protein